MADTPSSSSNPTTDQTSSSSSSSASDDTLSITLTHKSKPYTFTFPSNSTLTALTSTISTDLSIPPEYQKLIAPKLGVLKDPSLPLSSLEGKKLTLLGATKDEVDSVNKAAAQASRGRGIPPKGFMSRGKPAARDWKKESEEAQYTFLRLLPLPLPRSDLAMKLLERLRDDEGIKFLMRKYKWTVPLLTEMDPATNQTHDSKLLGLNRNKGEVIELRLRTDDYGGYRDYKTIRRTLIHELTHNVHSDHNRDFYDLMAVLEKEAARANWKEGGRALTEEVFYDPREAELEEGHVDGGGWRGGEYVLGGKGVEGLSRREVMARAAEERARREKEVREREEREK